MIRNVLFVCIGNICRSPIAEGYFARALPGRMVCSAGLHALVGEAADPLAIELMQERGIDITGHRARQLASWMAREADLIVTMDSEQKRYIERTWPAARGKVRRLCEGSGVDVPDPYRQGRDAFQQVRILIEDGMDELLAWMAASDAGTIPAPATSTRGFQASLQPSLQLPP